LTAVSSAFFAQHFLGNTFADAPVQQCQTRIDCRGNGAARFRDELTKIRNQGWRDQADCLFRDHRFCLLWHHTPFSNRLPSSGIAFTVGGFASVNSSLEGRQPMSC
jgi:hypothetical protein